jgi:hypothetical protein
MMHGNAIMTGHEFKAVAWRGAEYGLKIKPSERDKYLNREWGSLKLYFAGEDRPVNVNIDKDSFWKKDRPCCELISKQIGVWLIKTGLAPWPKGRPPRFKLVPLAPRAFLISVGEGEAWRVTRQQMQSVVAPLARCTSRAGARAFTCRS